jgi:heptosyltransferase I
MIQSICIVRLSSLGDVLMLVPLVRTLQHHFPNAKLTWVIADPAYELVRGMDNIEFIVVNRANPFLNYFDIKVLRHRKFDVLLATHTNLHANLIYPFIHAKRKIGFAPNRAKYGHQLFINEMIDPGHEQDHMLETFLKFADVLGVTQKSVRWDLPIDSSDDDWAKNYMSDKPLLIVNPASSKIEKNWCVDRYIEVIKYAQSVWGMRVALTGGPDIEDRRLADSILSHASCLDLVGKTKPKQLMALISQASVLLCPDTGPAHMANAVGTPVIALHAVSSAKISGPYLYQHLAVDRYVEASQCFCKKLTNRPFGKHIRNKEAMRLISVNAVKLKLDSILSV